MKAIPSYKQSVNTISPCRWAASASPALFSEPTLGGGQGAPNPSSSLFSSFQPLFSSSFRWQIWSLVSQVSNLGLGYFIQTINTNIIAQNLTEKSCILVMYKMSISRENMGSPWVTMGLCSEKLIVSWNGCKIKIRMVAMWINKSKLPLIHLIKQWL